jgi:putative polyhydroxyalkanoate system protein
MSKIKVERSHDKGLDWAKSKAEEVSKVLSEKYGLSSAWKGEQTLEFSGKGVDGSLGIEDNRLSVSLKLGLMLRPFASKIEESVNKAIDRAISGE